MKPTDRAKVTAFVATSPDDAFDVFTREVEQWWRKEPRFRFGGEKQEQGALKFEDSGAERRLVETFGDGPENEFEVGLVTVWEPGERLTFQWKEPSFASGELTEVDVRFERAPRGTRVTLEHRGWDAIAPGHAARRGLDGTAFTDMIGLHWGDLITAFRLRASRPAR